MGNPTIIVSSVDRTITILGFTGSISSGCTYIADLISKSRLSSKYNFHHYKLSQIIDENSQKDSKGKISILQKQKIGNELRKINGGAYLVAQIIQRIPKNVNDDLKSIILIDGIKNHQEVQFLKQWFSNFFLFSICADKEIRMERSLKKGIVKSVQEFNDVDDIDEHEELIHGQQVKWCNYLSDIVIRNDEDYPPANDRKRDEFTDKILKYLTLINNNVYGEVSHDLKPTIDELSMTLAYAVSTMSSCIKRKVGSVIIKKEKSRVISDNTNQVINKDGRIIAFPNVVSSGYNEGPIGSQSCILDLDYQMCYRDFMFQTIGNKFKCCPNCGQMIDIDDECHKCKKKINVFLKYCDSCGVELDINYECRNPKCKMKIFDEFVPGGKRALGKSLDICRSLHAEEQAIMRMPRNIHSENCKLSLYVTTQPCKLCANKIASSGIEEVVYVEPYSMKDVSKILDDSKVEVTHFEGVKGPSFYKLFLAPIGFTNILKTKGD